MTQQYRLLQPTARHLIAATSPGGVLTLLPAKCVDSKSPGSLTPVDPEAVQGHSSSSQPGHISSPTSHMALPSVLSPSKQVLCSPTRQPFSPCNSKPLQLSPCSAKRPLAALQHGFCSSASGVVAAAAAASGQGINSSHNSNSSSGSPAHKRQVPDAAASLDRQPGPLTPAVVHQPLAPSHPGSSSTPGHHHHNGHVARTQTVAAAAAAAGSTPRSSALQRGSIRHGLSSSSQQHHLATATTPTATAVDTIAAADQVPSPLAILEFPPELEAAVLPGQQQQQEPSLLGPHRHHHNSSGSHQQLSTPLSRPAMSGRRVNSRYDIPLGFDWLSGAPDHAPGPGDGKLELIMGPMFAGKTTRLINRVKEVSDIDGKLAVAVKSSKDSRYGCHWVVTHDGKCMRCYTAGSLAEFKEIMGPGYHKLQVIAIDEAQFFPDLLDFCAEAVDFDGKHVIVSGLSGDFKRRRFGQLLELMPMADSITTLKSTCAFCKEDALFSLRLVEAAGPQALVGGDDKYRATCRRCYLQHSGTMQ